MTNELAFTVMLFMALFAGLYMIWWIRKQERKQVHQGKAGKL
jgi:hypothetical protein